MCRSSGDPSAPLSADDVLDDIGSMLADLTDELDAMLHSEKQQAATASAANGAAAAN